MDENNGEGLLKLALVRKGRESGNRPETSRWQSHVSGMRSKTPVPASAGTHVR